MTGGDLVVQTLKAAGVDTVFGVASVHNLPVFDAMARLGVRAIMARHEQAAVHMADGYSRATGRLGVAVTSTGPGAANSMGAMMEAYWANSPVLQIAGNIERPFLGQRRSYLHEAKDQLGMLETVTKWAGQPQTSAEIPGVVAEAVAQALSGRRGPVAVDLCIDLQYLEAAVAIPTPAPLPAPAAGQQALRRAADLLASARRPLIWAGGGAVASGAGAQVAALAHALQAGVLTTLMGRGAVPEEDPLCLGFMASEPAVQELLAQGDVLLAVGTRFQGFHTQTYRLRLPPAIIHVDIDAEEFNRNYPAAVAVHGDAVAALQEILALLDGRGAAEPGWSERVTAARGTARANQRAALGPYEVILDTLGATLPRNAIVVKDSTIPAYTWGNRLLAVHESRTSIHAASMAIGPGLPLAVGAALAQPDRRVALIAGDGGFLLSVGELSAVAQYGVKLLVMVFNDGGYGVLRTYQDAIFEGRKIGVDMTPIDFAQVAQGMGVPGRRVLSATEFEPAVAWALAQPGPALLDIDMRSVGPMAIPYRGVARMAFTDQSTQPPAR